MANLFGRHSRREIFRRGGMLAAAQALGGRFERASAAALDIGANLYQSIGVRPILNARGTFTIITGSLTLPEVKRAMDEASRHFVQMDELMDGVGKRLAEITGAEWGIVTNGCCAALTHCTAAAIAGNNPERMQRLPDLTGLKNEVVIPSHSRNVYDHAIRMLGVKIVEVHEPSQLDAAFNDRTVMVYILGGPGADEGPLGTRVIAEAAKRRNVPVIVDAAAEVLTINPNVHLERGATAVAYSGGKCMRGPQAAGLLLGQKDWLQAAWANSAPHHAFGRSLKAGKEEIMGMLAAVEMWPKRDHKAEYQAWEAWLDHVATSVKRVDGITTKVSEPEGLSNHGPHLTIQWDAARVGITGQEVSKILLDTEPRVVLAGARGSRGGDVASSISIMPYQMSSGEEKVLAERLYTLLSKPPKFENPPAPTAPSVSVAGQWEARLEFGRGSASHTLILEQDGAKLAGTHRGEFYSGDLAGSVDGNKVRFRSSMRVEGTRLGYEFTGVAENDRIAGTVNLGEYGETSWTAERHKYRRAEKA